VHEGRGPLPGWLGHVAGATIVLATLLNGAGPYTRRVGATDLDAYSAYWDQRCGPRGVKPIWLGLGRECVEPERWWPRGIGTYIRRVAPYEWPLKLVKDVVVLALILVGVTGAGRLRAAIPGPKIARAALGLAAYVTGSALLTAPRDPLMAISGIRSFTFLAVALCWAGVATPRLLLAIARWCLALMLIQCALIPWEMLDGVKDRATLWLPLRAAGTLVNPNTLGVVAVFILAFALSFEPRGRLWAAYWSAAVVLVASAGSGVGWFALVLLAAATALDRVDLSPVVKMCGLAAVGLLCVSMIADLTGRRDILFSVTDGRWNAFRDALRQDATSLLFGSSLGAGTNTAVTLGRSTLSADSTVTMLIRQIGFLGLALFIVALTQIGYRHRPTRPLLLVFLLSIAAANVMETFPANVLLGLALADGLGHARGSTESSQGPPAAAPVGCSPT
jgi:hypothetical protein